MLSLILELAMSVLNCLFLGILNPNTPLTFYKITLFFLPKEKS